MAYVVAKATTHKDSVGVSAKSRSFSASSARQTAADKKKRGTPFGMTTTTIFPRCYDAVAPSSRR
jgi:hypothetical protein